jgi:hypothetical protein
MLSTGFGFLRPTRENSARVISNVNVIVFSRGNAATLTLLSEELSFPTAKGESQHERPSMPLRVYTLLTTL